MKTRLVLAVAALAVAAASCSNSAATKTPASGTPMNLTNTEWVLQDLSGTPALPNAESTLSFLDGGTVTGMAACNRFNGPYTLTGDKISFGPLATTRMACVPGVDEQERRVLEAFQNAERVEVDGNALRLFVKGSNQPLRYVRK